jgi:hypothetical protein
VVGAPFKIYGSGILANGTFSLCLGVDHMQMDPEVYTLADYSFEDGMRISWHDAESEPTPVRAYIFCHK